MKKAVAIPYIIALILGVVVIGLLGIWFVTSGGKFSSQSSKTLCDNKFLQYCIKTSTGTYNSFKGGTECENVESSYQTCDQILGTQSCKKKNEICNLNTDCCSGRCIDSGPSAVCG